VAFVASGRAVDDPDAHRERPYSAAEAAPLGCAP
jgi:hypothetical protein